MKLGWFLLSIGAWAEEPNSIPLLSENIAPSVEVRENYQKQSLEYRRFRSRMLQDRLALSNLAATNKAFDFTFRFKPVLLDRMVVREVKVRLDEGPWSVLNVEPEGDIYWDHVLVREVERGQRNLWVRFKVEVPNAFAPFVGSSRFLESEVLLPVFVEPRNASLEVKLVLDVEGWMADSLRLRIFEVPPLPISEYQKRIDAYRSLRAR